MYQLEQMNQEKHSFPPHRSVLIPYFVLTLLILIIFGSITTIYILHGDFPAHYQYAQSLYLTGKSEVPHFIYDDLVNVVRSLIPFKIIFVLFPSFGNYIFRHSFPLAGFIVAISAYLFLGYLIYNHMKEGNIPGGIWVTLGLMLVAPINLFTIPQHRLYLGYIDITDFHNPTMILLRPIALLLFWNLVAGISDKVTLKAYIKIAVLSILSVLTKPSLAICLLPAAVPWVIFLLLNHKPIQWKLLIFSFILPTTLFLAFQYAQNYLQKDQGAIAFQLFGAMLFYTPSVIQLGLLFLLSFAFPLITLILDFPEIKKHIGLVLAWMTFFIGVLYTYLLIETGLHAGDQNFAWSSEIALFILFTETTFFVLKKYSLIIKNIFHQIKSSALYIVLALHFLSGIFWYLGELFQRKMWWGW